jgi:hypothetical protein
MSRDRFLQFFYNLHSGDNTLEPKQESKNCIQIYKVKNFTEKNFQKNDTFDQYGSIDGSIVKFKGR